MPRCSMMGATCAPPRTMYRILASEHGECQRAPAARSTTALQQTRTSGHRTEPALVLGYHQTQGAGQMDLLLSVRDHGHFQPLRRRLDGCPPRTKGAGQTPD